MVQFAHITEPDKAAKVPTAQAVQVAGCDAHITFPYVPAAQAVQEPDEPAAVKLP